MKYTNQSTELGSVLRAVAIIILAVIVASMA